VVDGGGIKSACGTSIATKKCLDRSSKWNNAVRSAGAIVEDADEAQEYLIHTGLVLLLTKVKCMSRMATKTR